ncbi:MAG: GFA family protein [Alphaproteobacteria bacterium]|nr:GFA family protein [Alphaproteobacteria bacterium]
MKIDGGCHCGFLTYEGEADPERVVICHCTDCQTHSGSAFRTVAPVPSESFRFLSGEPAVYVKTAESGNQRELTFCPKCGSPIYATAVGEGPKDINIRVGTVRQRNRLVPKLQIWARSEQPWLGELGSLRKIEKESF